MRMKIIGLALFLTPTLLMAGFSVDSVSRLERGTGDRAFTFTVTLDTCFTACSVTLVTDDTTAVAGEDYVAVIQPLVFNASPDPQQRQVDVPVLGDLIVELDETFKVIFINPSGAQVDDNGQGTILNDDSATVVVYGVGLGQNEGLPVEFVASMSARVDVDVLIDYRTQDGTATETDGDYETENGTLTFRALAPVQSLNEQFDVATSPDSKVERDETMGAQVLNLRASGRDVRITQSSAIGTILNDDAATLAISDVVAAEGESGPSIFTFDVTLDREVDVGVDVNFGTADGTATVADNDYEQTFGMLLFAGAAGEVETVNVTVNGDTDPEPDESFFVNLSNIFASGRDVSFADDQGEGIILSEEAAIFSDDFESGDTSAWSG